MNIPDIIRNTYGFYTGDLQYYFKLVFFNAKNWDNPYHNFSHVFHVTWQCYDACEYYLNKEEPGWTPDRARNLMIAAIFHDYNHSGKTERDELEIETAVSGLRENIQEADRPNLGKIELIIRNTQFPYIPHTKDLDLEDQILRDADLSQALSFVWIQQVIFGLAREMNKPPLEILGMQKYFLENIAPPVTAWGKERFPKAMIEAKIEEASDLLELLK